MEEAIYSKNSPSTARVRTLIVEDSPLAMRAVVNLLETHPAMNVVGTATDGGSGLELARKQRPDLVITDLELPGMSGLEIAEALRQQFPGICVIVISVHEGCMWQNLSRRKGADAFLSKHNLHTDLLALIERLFARCAADGPCIAN